MNDISDYQKKILARNLQKYLDLHNMSQKDLADNTGIKKTTLSMWVRGNSYPRPDKIKQLADFFKIQTSDLTTEAAEDVFEPIFPEIFNADDALEARKYLRHMNVMAFSGRDITTQSDDVVLKMANFLRQQELNMKESFITVFGGWGDND